MAKNKKSNSKPDTEFANDTTIPDTSSNPSPDTATKENTNPQS